MNRAFFPLCVALAIIVPSNSAAPSADISTLPQLLEKSRSYEFGQDRTALDGITRLIASARNDPAQTRVIGRQLARFAASDATFAAKQFVCRQLVLIAAPEDVPHLSTLLTNEPSSSMAVYVLDHIPGPEATRALLEAAARTDGPAKIALINALGHRADPLALTQLAAWIDTSELGVAAAAAAALGRLGSPPAAGALRDAFFRPVTRPFVADAYLACAAALFQNGHAELAASVCRDILEHDSTAALRRAATRTLATIAPGERASLILDGFTQPGAEAQILAAQLINLTPPPPGLDQAVARIPDLHPSAQLVALRAVGEIKNLPALPVVTRLTTHEDASVRAEALTTLSAIGNRSSVPVLLQAAAFSSGAEQEAARRSLALLRASDVDTEILSLLPNANDAAATELVKALVARKAIAIVPRLVELAAATQPALRAAALQGLRELAPPTEIPRLIDVMLKLPSPQADAVSDAIAAIAQRAENDLERYTPVLTRYPSSRGSERVALLNLLGRLGGDPALRPVRDALRDADPGVQLAALRLLSEWPTDQAMNDLASLLKATSDPRLRALAFRGYSRMIGLNETRTPDDVAALYRDCMQLTQSNAERALVLSGLSHVYSLSALKLAAETLNDPALRAEAETAALSIARGTAGAHRDATRQLLAQIRAATSNELSKTRAAQWLEQIDRYGEFITAWLVSPAYSQPGADCARLFDIPFPPEQGKEPVTWRLLPPSEDPQQPWLLDLKQPLGGDQRVAYLRTRIWTDAAQDAILELGSDDGIKVWVNEKVVYSRNVQRAIAPAQERVPINLVKGWNPILLKVTQNVMGWAACARLISPDGSPLRVQASVE